MAQNIGLVDAEYTSRRKVHAPVLQRSFAFLP
jgi:hypothetical protein